MISRPLSACFWTAQSFLFIGLFGLVDAILLFTFALRNGWPHLDFFGIWSWACFEIESGPSLIYDHAAQHAFLLSLDPQFPVPMPFPYWPPYLLLIRPLGWLSYPVAQLLWTGSTLLAYLVAICAPAWRPKTVLVALLAPASAINLLYGQNGFLTAALLVGGIRLAPSRALPGGVLLGLLAYKPQFALVVIVALLAARLWLAALAATATVVAAAAGSLIVFGVAPWLAWVRAMPDFVAIVNAQRPRLLHLMPTALSNALELGASDQLAWGVQGAAMVGAAIAVWLVFRRDITNRAAAFLAVASMLASPYAFVYDLTLVGAAIALEPDLKF